MIIVSKFSQIIVILIGIITVRDPVPPQSEIILGPINQVAISGQTSSVVFECFGSGR